MQDHGRPRLGPAFTFETESSCGLLGSAPFQEAVDRPTRADPRDPGGEVIFPSFHPLTPARRHYCLIVLKPRSRVA